MYVLSSHILTFHVFKHSIDKIQANETRPCLSCVRLWSPAPEGQFPNHIYLEEVAAQALVQNGFHSGPAQNMPKFQAHKSIQNYRSALEGLLAILKIKQNEEESGLQICN